MFRFSHWSRAPMRKLLSQFYLGASFFKTFLIGSYNPKPFTSTLRIEVKGLNDTMYQEKDCTHRDKLP